MNDVVSRPTYQRQRFLLSFIRQLDKGATAIELQKLVFLYTMENNSDYYGFIPYKYGPYSFQLRADVDTLQRNGFVTVSKIGGGVWIRAAGYFTIEDYFPIAPERKDPLIRRVYLEYPDYTINSEIIGEKFIIEEFEYFERIRQNYVKNEQILFTIGYEGNSIERFINCIIRNGVRLLCDVRKNALSRKFGFSKLTLERITQSVGITYLHIPGLGIESDKRSSLETPEDYRRLFVDYEKTLPDRQNDIDTVFSLLQCHTRVALMCFESQSEMCHRHVVRDYIVRTHNVTAEDLYL